ncbi:MAG TPA: molecular chaperone [Prosthecochloris aestuarii]|uniref:Molecular chaperone n=1 Tax=Prosthecochloris aestuarii TaxID=1102 RepID=A0A831WS92_PROAE|nr:molecular chaperone [Prosthecochloris sp.]HED31405.1 molecular chaperone [Prosthecochloris aestuarii]
MKCPALFPILLLTLILCLPATSHAEDPPGQIAVFPSMFELEIGSRPVSESIRLKNLKKRPVTIEVDVFNWTLDKQNNLQIIPPDPQSLDQWMLINPLSFTIEPGQEQLIRFAIRPPVKPEPGEHRAIVYFTEQPAKDAEETAVQVLFKLGVGIYGYTDPLDKQAQLASLSLNRAQKQISATITNTGNVHTRIKGNYTIWKAGSFPGFDAMNRYLSQPDENQRPAGLVTSGSMTNTPVLPGMTRTITTDLPELPANAIIAVSGAMGETRIEKLFQ